MLFYILLIFILGLILKLLNLIIMLILNVQRVLFSNILGAFQFIGVHFYYSCLLIFIHVCTFDIFA